MVTAAKIWQKSIFFDILLSNMYNVGKKLQRQNSRTCLTLTLVSHCLTAVKLCSAVMSYITTTPSALRKNCLVMLRYLQQEDDKMFAEDSKSLNSSQTKQNHSSPHLSCPAVSHICSATWLLSTVIVFTL